MLKSTNTSTCLFIVLLSASALSNPINQNEDFTSMSREEYKYSVWSQIRDMIQLRLDQNEKKSAQPMQEQEQDHQPMQVLAATRHFHHVEQEQLQPISVQPQHQQPIAAQPVQPQQQQQPEHEQINNISREEYRYSVWSEITNMIQFRLDQNAKNQMPPQEQEQEQHHQPMPAQSATRHFHHVEQNQLQSMSDQPMQQSIQSQHQQPIPIHQQHHEQMQTEPIPAQPMPVQPQQPMPVQPIPVHQQHQQPMSAQPMPVKQKQHQLNPMPVHQQHTQPMSAQPMPLQPMPVQPQQPMPVQPMSVHQQHTQPMSAQPMPIQPMPLQPMPVHQKHQQIKPLLTQPEHEQITNVKLPVQPTSQSNTSNTKSSTPMKMGRTETKNQSVMTRTNTHLMPGETDIQKPNFHEFLPSQLSTEKSSLLSFKFNSPLFI